MQKKNLINKRFGLLVVVEEAPTRKRSNGGSITMWHCKCDCGKELDVIANSLLRGRTKSCGCAKSKIISEKTAKHRGIDDRLYHVWAGMKGRCYNHQNQSYQYYGGRGISVCEEWAESYAAFRDWATANGYDPNAEVGKCTIDRIDNNGDYTPTNCRWVGMDVQSTNKHPSGKAIKIEYCGQLKTIKDWSEITGISSGAIRERLRRGWSVENALATPSPCYRGRRGLT